MVYKVNYLDALTYNALEDREFIKAVLPTSGVLGGTSGFTPSFVSGTTFRFAAGRATVDSANGGAFLVSSDTNVDLTLSAVPGTAGQSRYDRIIARVYDNTQDALGQNKFQLEVVQGVAAAGPSEPALPINSLELARITLTNGVTPSAASILDRRVQARSQRDDTGWINIVGGVGFQGTWVKYAGGGTWPEPGYRRLDGVVYLRGLIASGTIPSVAFTLPVGFRPSNAGGESHLFVTGSSAAAGAGRIDILPNGSVQVAAPSTNTFVTLDGICYIADA